MMVNPILGYNTELPREVGLYRMLRSLALEKSIINGLVYHQSAGVGKFKYNRGAKGCAEYNMVYAKHLSKSFLGDFGKIIK